ncbi:MAG: ABC-2 type transport system permease protein [Planctomycetota bacterium]
MSKIIAIAKSEYLTAVRSKAFLIGLFLMPVIMAASIVIQKLVESKADVQDRKMAVVDATGELFSVLQAENAAREETLYEGEGKDRTQMNPRFLLERVVLDASGEERVDIALADRVRDGDLFAFLLIGADVLGEVGDDRTIAYHTQTPTYGELPRWAQKVLDDYVVSRRFTGAGYDRREIMELSSPTNFERLGLASVEAGTGKVVEAEKENKIKNQLVPGVGMFLMFMLIMMAAPPALNNVLEEKMQKISEVLVSAVTPFQLILGKLVGTASVALTLSVVYLGGATVVLHHFGYGDLVDPQLYAWFFVFLILAVFIFGSVFTAIGAACSEIRDAQSLMTPAMLMIMLPMFLFGPVMDAPDSALARWASLFPPATPFLMFLRIGIPPGAALWEILLGVVLCTLFTLSAVWAGGKIFRIGLLSQGQAPSFLKLIGWVLRK